MKVLDLECAQRHAFEGWFGSEDDFQNQLGRSLVACPICNDTQIVKRLPRRLPSQRSRPTRPLPNHLAETQFNAPG